MQINVLVSGSLYSSQSGFSAVQFCRAAIAGGHQISQVFFYQDGVTQSNSLSTPLDDEFNALTAWTYLSKEHHIELVVCVSAAERRGIMSEQQANEFGKDAESGNLHPLFSVAGLGALHEASLSADRTVTFK